MGSVSLATFDWHPAASPPTPPRHRCSGAKSGGASRTTQSTGVQVTIPSEAIWVSCAKDCKKVGNGTDMGFGVV